MTPSQEQLRNELKEERDRKLSELASRPVHLDPDVAIIQGLTRHLDELDMQIENEQDQRMWNRFVSNWPSTTRDAM